MIISISGNIGSGKSTVAKKLAQKLGWPNYYMGEIRRLKAKSLGMTLAEYNKLGENNPNTDLEVDRFQEKLGTEQDNFVIEGRTSWYFIPHSKKIYIWTEESVGAERIFKELQQSNFRNENKNLNTVDDVLENIKQRTKSDIIRYRQYYNIDAYDKNNYDLVINSTNLNENEVFEELYKYISQFLPNN